MKNAQRKINSVILFLRDDLYKSLLDGSRCLGFGSPGRSGFGDKIRVIRIENPPNVSFWGLGMDRFGGKDSDGSGIRSPCSLYSFSRYSAFITCQALGQVLRR